MGSELCKTCIHTKICMKDKNLVGDVPVMGHPMFFDNDKLWAEYKERKKQGFPCEDYMSTAEPKRGKWEEKSTFDIDENGDQIIKEWQSARCSVCGRYHTTPYMYYFNVYNYCPNCGARMEGKDE